MSLIDHARREFKVAGWLNDEGEYVGEVQQALCEGVIRLLEVFTEEGHSGFSAMGAISLFTRLAKFEPITALTGEDSEWINVSEYGNNNGPLYQNNRSSQVFKDDGGAYDIDGKVFWEWRGTKEDPHKTYYSNSLCRTPVTFPYVVPENPEYVYRYPEDDDAPAQTEEGIL